MIEPNSQQSRVLIIGSGPNAVDARSYDRAMFDRIVAVNNAWQVRDDWDYHIHPDDFPEDRWPQKRGHQMTIRANNYVPVQNDFGGFVYAGGTMAFTTGYWALGASKPRVLAFIGCDMVYDAVKTHFYGVGMPDPLRKDVSLRSLEAKSARLMVMASMRDTLCVNLSTAKRSRLVFPSISAAKISKWTDDEALKYNHQLKSSFDLNAIDEAKGLERQLNYFVASGKYWKEEHTFEPKHIDRLDALWLRAINKSSSALANSSS